MRKFPGWFWPLSEPPPPSLDAQSVAKKIGEEQGIPIWIIVVQLRDPRADFDALYSIRCVSKNPPDVGALVGHYLKHPEDFKFIDFLPNPNKK